ncbi:hypothetical protein QBC46DRAFT_336288 [Diplogelasinospora grovesii]|uniref:Uncharacterized protein n=1 Tax=Diplogelasinospora grovesii TaxID=303347 RepID=A0AAN6NIR2_9PEZI|nr:hypothetical protein QBC46DRAFT_336288 [Diplogelasinospora grovesii]
MLAVSSLVGTGTVVAAAAAGLVFGQPDSDTSSPSSNRGELASSYDNARMQHAFSRPGTSNVAAASPVEEFPYSSFQQHSEAVSSGSFTSYPPNSSRTPRLFSIHITPPKGAGRRHSFIRQGDVVARPIAENARESISSRDSWIRRLSIRPLSQHGSPRSSMGLDSPTLSYSQASGAPILPGSPIAASHMPPKPPNKLVKRTPSGQDGPSGTLSRRGSRTQMPSLRRPATSHQRSATLQQFQDQGGFSGPPVPPSEPMYTLIQKTRKSQDSPPAPKVEPVDVKQAPERWTSFFHSRAVKSADQGSPRQRGNEASPNNNSALPPKRIALPLGNMTRVYLIKARWLSESHKSADKVEGLYNNKADHRESSPKTSNPTNSTESTPSRRARKSISMHFSSPSNWIPRSGSLRRAKRGAAESKGGDNRHVSAPVSTTQNFAQPAVKHSKPALQEISTSVEPRQQQIEPESSNVGSHLQAARKRNSSSPLPPLSRLSSFNIDVARLGLSSSSSTGPTRPLQHPINYMSGSYAFSGLPRSRGGSGERSSTLAGSDLEAREGFSGDDEDTDFRSDGMFDSFRTVASSSRMRTVETPLDSMFDESPPSTAGNNSKTKRLSIQEILGRSWDGDTRIMEEDESLPTPIRTAHLADPVEFDRRDDAALAAAFDFGASLPGILSANRDFGRLSLDDDDDDDWARDDENGVTTNLSPPSSSVNSRRVSPTLRHALVTINGNGSSDLLAYRDATSDRPRSNIFNWVEGSHHDKFDAGGHSPRPKTVHGKQELDLRGGRSTNRKGPTATHIRSQSVPVVPDPTSDNSKPTPKFGTWGMGTKNVSEDWDDDFDFDESDAADLSGGKDSATSFSMIVPASIQATQPTVKAHSGQIRELSLLVNDLKRLCRHGRDLDILHGPAAAKWKEAENIIALASPDEDDEVEEETDTQEASPDTGFDPSKIDERFLDHGFDGRVLDNIDYDPFDSPERGVMTKTTVVRERTPARRRSVFSPDDDIFGCNWPLTEETSKPETRPHTPPQMYHPRMSPNRNSAIISTVIEAMQHQRSISESVKNTSPCKPSNSKLFFDTNSLQELVKRAGQLRDSLSDVVRRAELLTQSPAGTPRRERHNTHSRHNNPDGSPAFTRVFTDPASSPPPPKRLPKSHSTNSVLSRGSVDSHTRMQMMTVS